MKTTDFKYYNYLKNRSRLNLWLRKNFILKSTIREFKGKVLDIGCGIGEFMQLYHNSYGIETNRYLVNHCRKNGFRVVYGSIFKIPFKKNTFDGVFCSHVLEHLKNSEKAIFEIRRVLKKDGILLLIVPTKKGYERDPTHVKNWNEKDIVKILNKFNFKIKKIIYFPFLLKILKDMSVYSEIRVIAEKE